MNQEIQQMTEQEYKQMLGSLIAEGFNEIEIKEFCEAFLARLKFNDLAEKLT
jgi:hypothetical protein